MLLPAFFNVSKCFSCRLRFQFPHFLFQFSVRFHGEWFDRKSETPTQEKKLNCKEVLFFFVLLLKLESRVRVDVGAALIFRLVA